MKSANVSPRVLPFTPAVSDSIQSVAEAAAPYATRLVRAVVVLLGAMSFHTWGLPAPHPQERPLAAFASRMMRPPSVPSAPPLLPPAATGSSPASQRNVVVENRLVRVWRLPALADSPRTLRAEQVPVPVGMSGRIALATPKSSTEPSHLPAPPPGLALSPAPAAPPAVKSTEAAVTIPDDERGREALAQKEEEVVLALLQEYSRAYERMDVRATKALYPSVDDRSLRRAFGDLKGQQLHFASCGVAISSSGAGANAWCRGDATFRPKVGSRVYLPNREWTFSLGREGDGWQILKATMQ
jgi:hypothetical protein